MCVCVSACVCVCVVCVCVSVYVCMYICVLSGVCVLHDNEQACLHQLNCTLATVLAGTSANVSKISSTTFERRDEKL